MGFLGGEKFQLGVRSDKKIQPFRRKISWDFIFQNFKGNPGAVADAEDRVRKFVVRFENAVFAFAFADVLDQRLSAEGDGKQCGKIGFAFDLKILWGNSRLGQAFFVAVVLWFNGNGRVGDKAQPFCLGEQGNGEVVPVFGVAGREANRPDSFQSFFLH